MRPYYSPSSRENATPSSSTSPLASYKKYPTPRDSDSTVGKQGLVSSSNPPDGYQQLHLTTK